MMLVQLNPLVPLITPKGNGNAHFLIENGIEHDLEWVVFINETGECWSFRNPYVRLQKNLTLGRDSTSEIILGK